MYHEPEWLWLFYVESLLKYGYVNCCIPCISSRFYMRWIVLSKILIFEIYWGIENLLISNIHCGTLFLLSFVIRGLGLPKWSTITVYEFLRNLWCTEKVFDRLILYKRLSNTRVVMWLLIWCLLCYNTISSDICLYEYLYPLRVVLSSFNLRRYIFYRLCINVSS